MIFFAVKKWPLLPAHRMLGRDRIKRHSHLIKVKSQFAARIRVKFADWTANHSAHSTHTIRIWRKSYFYLYWKYSITVLVFLCESKWKGFALEINSTKVFLKSGEAQKSVRIEWLSSYSVVVIIMQQSYNHMLIIQMALTKEKETLTPFQCVECAFWILLIDSFFFKSK